MIGHDDKGQHVEAIGHAGGFQFLTKNARAGRISKERDVLECFGRQEVRADVKFRQMSSESHSKTFP